MATSWRRLSLVKGAPILPMCNRVIDCKLTIMDKIEFSSCREGQQADPTWNTAWAWVKRQYGPGGFDAIVQREFVAWITAAPANRAAYESAAWVWLMAGLVPPVNDVLIPGCDDAVD